MTWALGAEGRDRDKGQMRLVLKGSRWAKSQKVVRMPWWWWGGGRGSCKEQTAMAGLLDTCPNMGRQKALSSRVSKGTVEAIHSLPEKPELASKIQKRPADAG